MRLGASYGLESFVNTDTMCRATGVIYCEDADMFLLSIGMGMQDALISLGK